MLLSTLVVVFSEVLDDGYKDGRNVVIIGDRRGIICRSADMMITISLILFHKVGIRIKLIPGKENFEDGEESNFI